MPSRILIACLILASLPLHAGPRAWKSADGLRSVQGELLKREASSITIRRADQKEFTISLKQLHQDDIAWLDENHPLAKPEAPRPRPVFDELRFGDKRAEVTEKLKASKIVELTIQETFLGRTGLNGVFRTRQKIGGLDVMLFFDWTDDGDLKEITLQSAAIPEGKFNEQLQPCWQEFVKLLTSLHGQPVTSSTAFNLSSIPDGAILPTHLWKLPETGSAILGAARQGNQYQIAIRFTLENIKPVEIPDVALPGG